MLSKNMEQRKGGNDRELFRVRNDEIGSKNFKAFETVATLQPKAMMVDRDLREEYRALGFLRKLHPLA